MRHRSHGFVKYFAEFPGAAIIDNPEKLCITGRDTFIDELFPARRTSKLPYLEVQGDYEDHREYAFRIAVTYPKECHWLLGCHRDLPVDDTPQWVYYLRHMLGE